MDTENRNHDSPWPNVPNNVVLLRLFSEDIIERCRDLARRLQKTMDQIDRVSLVGSGPAISGSPPPKKSRDVSEHPDQLEESRSSVHQTPR